MDKIKLYTYKKCQTCIKAKKFLENKKMIFQEIPIRENPPTKNELKTLLAEYQNNKKSLCNSSGQDYRKLNIKEKINQFTDEEFLNLLKNNGNLIKRPFLISPSIKLVGFKQEIWQEKFKKII